ncbi:MAG: hypothetical protein LBP19_10505 [Treponema sp.]|jgi:hypothetical protein|nr:hypothetical protein [Treponema sp.]
MRSSDEQNNKNIPEVGQFLSSGPVYGLLALYIPLSLLATAVFLTAEMLPVAFPSLRILISGFLSGIAASVYYDLIRDTVTNHTAHTAAHLRGGIAVAALAYLLVSLGGFPLPLARRFFPSLANLLAAFAAVYVWAMVIFLKQIFRGLYRFDLYMERYTDEELQKKLAEDAAVIHIASLDAIKNVCLPQLVVLGLSVMLYTAFRRTLPPPLAVFLLSSAVSAVCIGGFLSLMKQTWYFASEGMTIPLRLRLKRLMGIAVLAAAACALAAGLASNKSLIPLSLIARFFQWLFSVFKRPAPAVPRAVHQPEPVETPPVMEKPFFEGMEETAPWEGWKYVQYGFIALLAFGCMWFMIKPFFERRMLHSRFSTRLRFLFTSWMQGLKWALLSLLSVFTGGGASLKINRKKKADISRISDQLETVYPAAKTKEMRRNISLFARLIVWGYEVCGVTWKPSHAPGEFCSLLAAAVFTSASAPPDTGSSRAAEHETNRNASAASVIRCGVLFEQTLYSGKSLTQAEQDEFNDVVAGITQGDSSA